MNSLILDFRKKEPGEVPTLAAVRIIVDPPLGVFQKIGTERVFSGQAPELAEKVVGRDVVIPSIGHGCRVIRHIDRYEHLLYPTEFGQGVDPVAAKRVQHLVNLRLRIRC